MRFFFAIAAAAFFPGITPSLVTAGEHPSPAALPSVSSPDAARQNQFSTTSLVVNVTVNTVSKGDLFGELDGSGNMFLKPEDLDALHLAYDDNQAVFIRGERYIPVAAVLGATASFDEKRLSLSFIGKTTETGMAAIDVFPLRNRPKNLYIPRETSAFLNYALSSTYSDESRFDRFSATTKLGVRTGDAFFTSDGLYTKTPDDERFVRLQSSATYERRDNLQWFVLGDGFAGSGDLGSSVNMGGLGIVKVFRIDPYYITQPVFNIQGANQYPTEAEIYIDGMLASKQSLMPGAFNLKNLYSYNGAHDIVLVLRDPFGKEQRISQPAYFNTTMLRAGLHEYGYQGGFLRERYGIDSNDYGKAAFSAFHRYGLAQALNIGGRAEGMDGLLNAGLSLQLAEPWLGALSLSAARSDAKELRGSALMAKHSLQVKSVSTNLLLREYSRGYATLAQPGGGTDESTKRDVSFSTGFPVARLGSLSLSYTTSENQGGQATRVLSGNYSRGLTKSTSLFATASETNLSTRTDPVYALFVGLQINLDGNLRGTVQHSRSGGANSETVALQKSAPIGEGWGYRASFNRTDAGSSGAQSFNPAIQYNGRYGIFTADSSFRKSDGETAAAHVLSLAGSLVSVGGFFGASRPVSDSFAIVAVNKMPNAVVRNNGEEIGTTGSLGSLVVPTLASYGQNRITLDVTELPLDISVSGTNKVLSPSLWSGVCIGFDVIKTQAITGRIVAADEKGLTPVEYQEATIPTDTWTAAFPTGKGGEFYLETALPAPSDESEDSQSCRSIKKRRDAGRLTIEPGIYTGGIFYKGERCTFEITVPETDDMISEAGEIQCTVQKEEPEPASEPEPQAEPDAEALQAPAVSRVEQDPPRSIAVSPRFTRSGGLVYKKDRKAVAALVRYLKKHPGQFISIEIHGDRHGAGTAALRLGRKQAELIRKYLITSGVKADRIQRIESLGNSRMLCFDATAACDKVNRRALVRVEENGAASEQKDEMNGNGGR